MSLTDGGTIALSNIINGGVVPLQNAGAPTDGTSEVQTITLSNFGACTLSLTFMGFTAEIDFDGDEDNTAIDTAVTSALEALNPIGSGGVSVGVTGTTNRAIAVTFTGALAKLAVPLISASVSGGSAEAATLSTNLAGDNNDLTYTAVTAGTAGNSITIAYTDPSANDQELGVVVTGTDIVVNLATGGAGAITSTAADIAAAIEADTDAAALVTVANKTGNDGTGVVIAMAETALAGGLATESVAVVETTPGVTATGRGAAKGSRLTDTTNGTEYINEGTGYEPSWNNIGAAATGDIANGAVTAAKLATDAVETAKIKDANVTAAKLASDAVETAKIKDVNVTTGKLANGAVTFAKAKVFVSTEQTGTGAPQNVAHGLAAVPAAVLVAPTLHPGTPDTGAFSVVEGAHDGTNVIVTVTADVKFKVLAWV